MTINHNKLYDRGGQSRSLTRDMASTPIRLFNHLGNGGSFTLNGSKTVSVSVVGTEYSASIVRTTNNYSSSFTVGSVTFTYSRQEYLGNDIYRLYYKVNKSCQIKSQEKGGTVGSYANYDVNSEYFLIDGVTYTIWTKLI